MWLYEHPTLRIEGRIAVSTPAACGVGGPVKIIHLCSLLQPLYRRLLLQGFDEYMNIVLDDAEEVDSKRKTRTPIGRILLKGDNITLMAPAGASAPALPPPFAAVAVAEIVVSSSSTMIQEE